MKLWACDVISPTKILVISINYISLFILFSEHHVLILIHSPGWLSCICYHKGDMMERNSKQICGSVRFFVIFKEYIQNTIQFENQEIYLHSVTDIFNTGASSLSFFL